MVNDQLAARFPVSSLPRDLLLQHTHTRTHTLDKLLGFSPRITARFGLPGRKRWRAKSLKKISKQEAEHALVYLRTHTKKTRFVVRSKPDTGAAALRDGAGLVSDRGQEEGRR